MDLLPRSGDADWRDIAARLRRDPRDPRRWRHLEAGPPGPGRGPRASVAAGQADGCAGRATRWWSPRRRPLGDSRRGGPGPPRIPGDHPLPAQTTRRGPPSGTRSARAVAPGGRLSLGADIDLAKAYSRLGQARPDRGRAGRQGGQGQPRCEPGRGGRGAERGRVRDRDRCLPGLAAEPARRAIERLDGVPFDIAPTLRRVEVVLARGSTSGRLHTPADEDLTRPGGPGEPLGGRGTRPVRDLVRASTIFHEGVPGHRLQRRGQDRGDRLSHRQDRVGHGHGEGWALYAERPPTTRAGFEAPVTRLRHAERIGAARRPGGPFDIGVHPRPAAARRLPVDVRPGLEMLREHGRASRTRCAEVIPLLGWPGTAISCSYVSALAGGQEQAMRGRGPVAST